MKYFESEDGRLVQFFDDQKIYRIKNTIDRNNDLTEEEFNSLKVQQVKKARFNALLNNYFRRIKHSWTFEGTKYRKIDNFEVDSNGDPTNYKLTDFQPNEYGHILVYHRGQVFRFNWSYNGYEQGQLFNSRTGVFVKWTRPKNCSPVFNEDTKSIC